MIKLKFNLLILAILALTGGIAASSPDFKSTIKKEIHETFEVNEDVTLGVHNKYGDIKISTWDKNQIDVHVLIQVKSNNAKKAQTFLDAVDIDFSSSSSKVGIKTIYPDQENSSWWSSWWGSDNNLDYKVHYTISAPRGMSSTLINKYGNISQQTIDGSCDVVNKYGDIFLENVGDNLDFDLGYGKSKMGSVGDAKMVVKYSDIKVKECKDLDLDTKYSDYTFGTCGEARIDSKYDEFEIGSAIEIINQGKYDNFKIENVERFSISTKYTDVKINHLGSSFQFGGKYGSVRVKNSGDLDMVKIESKYTGFEFGMDCDYTLNYYGDDSSLKLSQPYEMLDKSEDGNDLKVKASRGSQSNGAQIDVVMKYGSFKLYSNQEK